MVSKALLDDMAREIDGRRRQALLDEEADSDNRLLVEKAQFLLGVLGLYSGEHTGVKDVELDQAILRFQASNRLSADGVLSTDLVESLRDMVFQ